MNTPLPSINTQDMSKVNDLLKTLEDNLKIPPYSTADELQRYLNSDEFKAKAAETNRVCAALVNFGVIVVEPLNSELIRMASVMGDTPPGETYNFKWDSMQSYIATLAQVVTQIGDQAVLQVVEYLRANITISTMDMVGHWLLEFIGLSGANNEKIANILLNIWSSETDEMLRDGAGAGLTHTLVQNSDVLNALIEIANAASSSTKANAITKLGILDDDLARDAISKALYSPDIQVRQAAKDVQKQK